MFINFPEVHMRIEKLGGALFPPMIRVRQKYDAQKIENISEHFLGQLQYLQNQEITGKRIAIAVGSRGIPHLADLLKVLSTELKSRGAFPFIVPSMGSHGGATAEGQEMLLRGYGITEATVGVPIVSDMAVEQYGEVEGIPLYCDRAAAKANGIIILNKIKPHTDFRGDIESGLCKMIAIGLGKHKGATALHAAGFAQFPHLLPKVAEIFLHKMPVLCGIGLVQNAYDEICALEVTPPDRLIETDKRLLKLAKERIARFKFLVHWMCLSLIRSAKISVDLVLTPMLSGESIRAFLDFRTYCSCIDCLSAVLRQRQSIMVAEYPRRILPLGVV